MTRTASLSSASVDPQDSEDPVKCHPIMLAVGLLATTSSLCLSDSVTRTTRPALEDTRPVERGWLTAVEPGPSIVQLGDQAPDFSYQTESGEWLKFHQLLDHGSVMLVFVPTEDELRVLEGERDSLYSVGVIPVAVLDRRTGTTAAMAHRLRLGYPVIADPQGAIASQFNLVGPPTVRAAPGWFIVDRAGRVRGLERRRLPEGGFTRIACDMLAIPAPDATVMSGGR
jgi:peroxiredoxin